MTENKGDLISRSALRKAFKNHPLCNGVWLQYSREIIDSAPTVEPKITEKQAITTIINSGWLVKHDKELRDKWERPQGEWQRRTMNQYLCSNCHYNVNSVESLFYKFCPKCGADMRKGGEES